MGLISRVSSRTYRFLKMADFNTSRKSSTEAVTESLPDEVKVMKQILHEMDVKDYEPCVIEQMLDFSFTYLTEVLGDAKVFSEHAGRDVVALDDVKLAVKMEHDKNKRNAASLPSRNSLVRISREKNSTPIEPKPIQQKLPADRFCMHQSNFEWDTSRANQVEGLVQSSI